MDRNVAVPCRVAVVADVDFDSMANGIATYLRTFVRHAQGLTCRLWTPSRAAQLSQGLDAARDGGWRGRWRAQWVPARVRNLVDVWCARKVISKDADVLFIQSSEYVLPFALGGRWPPIVLVMHGWNPPAIGAARGAMRYLWLRMADAIAVRKAARVVMVSAEGLRGFQRRHPRCSGKFVHVPTFLDDDFVRSALEAAAPRRRSPGDGPVLLCVCRLVREKQVDRALEVYAKVRRELPGAVLIIVGDGPERGRLEAQAAKLGVAPGVRFQGEVPHEAIGGYLADADHLLLLSLWEGTSIALLEALAYGVSVVTTDVADHALIVDRDAVGCVVATAGDADKAAAWVVGNRRKQKIDSDLRRGLAGNYLASVHVGRICRLLLAEIDLRTPRA